MRTTVSLDDELVAKVQAFTGLTGKSSLVREALKALIERRVRYALPVSAALTPRSPPRPVDVPILHDIGRQLGLDRPFPSR